MAKGYQTHPRTTSGSSISCLLPTWHSEFKPLLNLIPDLRKREVVHIAMFFVDSTQRGLRNESHCKERSWPVSPRSKAVKSMKSPCIGCCGILSFGGSRRNDKTLPYPELGFPGVSKFNTMLSCNHTENSSLTSDLHSLRRYAVTTFRD